MRHTLSVLACVAALCLGCTGKVDDATKPFGAGGGTDGNGGAGSGAQLPPGENPGGVTPDTSCKSSGQPGPTPLLKLTTTEYRNTVRDLLAATGATSATSKLAQPLAAIPDDSLGSSFRGLDNRISLEHVQGYFNVGVALGDAVLADTKLLTAMAGSCATLAMTEPLSAACAKDFANKLGKLAYRRPLSSDELDVLTSLNDGTRKAPEAVRAMIVVAMSSPRFVNHLELDGTPIGSDDTLLKLDGYEIASRLSYAFWQTMPDDELFAAAADKSITTKDGFAKQLDRVWNDDRTRATLWQFWNEWLRLEKFTGFEATRPAFAALAQGESLGEPGHDHYADMVQEIHDLTDLFTFERSATVSELLTTNESVTKSADLAHLYGVKAWSGSGEYPTFADGERAGLLQRGALLVSSIEQTNPFHRGAVVRRSLMCDALQQPNPNALPPGSLDPPPSDPKQTTRERYAAKIAGNNLCLGCHVQFADIGYALESYDALGRFRSQEEVYDQETGKKIAELPIDTKATPRIAIDDDKPVSSVAELNQRIVDSGKVEACLAQNYFSYLSRRTQTAESLDACVISDLSTQLKDPKVGLGGAMQRLAQYSSFFQHKVGPQ